MRGRAKAAPTSESAVAIPHSTIRYQRAPGTFARRTPRSLVLLTGSAHVPVRITGSAADVWDMLATSATAVDLLRETTSRLGDASTMVSDELAAALDVLIEAGAVVTVP